MNSMQAALQAQQDAVAARDQAEQALAQVRDSAEVEIDRRTQELLETVRALEAFNNTVAHDLRGPLSGVSGLTQLIKRRLESGDLAQIPRWLDQVCTQTERLGALVSGLLICPGWRGAAAELTALSTWRRRPSRRSHQQPAAVQACFRNGPYAHSGVDPLLLRQVFVNLVGNAAKFCREMPAPMVKVAAEVQGQQVVVRIVDNGVGFDPQFAADLFQPIVRLHGKHYEGTGIGLPTVKRIVEMHGGRVWAESAPGLGATFRFSLPAAHDSGSAQT
jgi:signal transduction histidine kinase